MSHKPHDSLLMQAHRLALVPILPRIFLLRVSISPLLQRHAAFQARLWSQPTPRLPTSMLSPLACQYVCRLTAAQCSSAHGQMHLHQLRPQATSLKQQVCCNVPCPRTQPFPVQPFRLNCNTCLTLHLWHPRQHKPSLFITSHASHSWHAC